MSIIGFKNVGNYMTVPFLLSKRTKELCNWNKKSSEWEGKPCGVGVSATRTGCIPERPDGSQPSTTPSPANVGQVVQQSHAEPPIKRRAEKGKMVFAKRVGKGKNATVVLFGGKQAPSHIKPAMIPPAWKNVKVSLDPEADVQVQARDGKGRAKTVYHERFVQNNQAAKFSKIAEGLQKQKEMFEQNLKNVVSSDEKTKEAAACVWLMQEQATRPGSEADTKGFADLYGQKVTKDNVIVTRNKKGVPSVVLALGDRKVPMKDAGTKEEIIKRLEKGEDLLDSDYWLKSYGATTLEGRHVVEAPDGVRLKFQGKEGVWHDHLIKNPELAKMLLERKKTSGERKGKLFGTDY
jgi:hypothetical protein